jgi:uncharacterized protein (TIGR02145 family)
MKIFINYRHEDEANITFAIANALMGEFGVGNIFFDKQAIKAGSQFTKEIDKALDTCRIFIPIIGKEWMNILNKRQTFEETDYVLNEIEHAMEKGIFILPILVDDTKMPAKKELPPKLGALSFINAINISSDPKHLPSDIKLLIAELKEIFSRLPKRSKCIGDSKKIILKKTAWILGSLISIIVIVILFKFYFGKDKFEQKSGVSDLEKRDMVQSEREINKLKEDQVTGIDQKDKIAQKQSEPKKEQRDLSQPKTEIKNFQEDEIADIDNVDNIDQKPTNTEKEQRVLPLSRTEINNLKDNQLADIDGNIYNTVRIGDQVWMAENLKVIHYNNGDPIPNKTDSLLWVNSQTGAYCSYDNLISNSEIYGHLYNWYAVDDKRGLCPAGWHVPSKEEFKILRDHLGGWEIAGGKLKETGFDHWLIPNVAADNSTGFTALPGGERTLYKFLNIKWRGFFWSSTTSGRTFTYLEIGFSNPELHIVNQSYPFDGFSVRCIKD